MITLEGQLEKLKKELVELKENVKKEIKGSRCLYERRVEELEEEIRAYEDAINGNDLLKAIGELFAKILDKKVGCYNSDYKKAQKDKKLLKLLIAKYKAQNKAKIEAASNQGFIIEIGCSVDDLRGGMEIEC